MKEKPRTPIKLRMDPDPSSPKAAEDRQTAEKSEPTTEAPDPQPGNPTASEPKKSEAVDADPLSQGSSANFDDTTWMRDAFGARAGDHGPGGPLGGVASTGPQRLSEQEWLNLFCLPFAVARAGVAQQAGVDLKSLMVTPATPGAREAAKSAMELCLAVPWLEPITRKDGGLAVHALTLGAFVVGVVQAAQAELRERAARDVTPPRRSDGAATADNDDGA
ncbi:MAG: hypothetical protein ACX939_03040, partial [Hyphococcus sp.]